MSTTNTGGAAFPDPGRAQSAKQREQLTETGMTLRDYFAAKAPITVEDAMLACGVDAHSIGMLPASRRTVILVALATMRGEYADAMLAARGAA